MSGAGLTDAKTFTVWRSAIIEVLQTNRRKKQKLLKLLRRDDIAQLITRDAAEFIAWLLEPRSKRGVRPLPRKFRLYQEMAREPALFDALDEIHQRRVLAGGRLSNLQRHYKDVAKAFGVKQARLEVEDRRSRKSGRRIGY